MRDRGHAATIEARLHAAKPGTVEAELVAIALERTGAEHGALVVWDKAAGGLALVHHVVGGVTVTLPRVLTRDAPGDRAGLALHVFDTDEPYLCVDTARDPHYTRYLLDVGALAAAPVRYQQRPIGVLTVSTKATGALDDAALARLVEVAELAAPLLRRAQVDRTSRAATGRPLVIKGLSPEWLEVERKLELAAPTTAPILIRGESGTGTDLVARAIHWNSRRADTPYVTVTCAAIPDTLLESLLFRARQGRVHQRDVQQARRVPKGRRRHAVSRRGRRAAGAVAGEGAARGRARRSATARLERTARARRRAPDLRDQPRSRSDVEGGDVSRRPLLPALGDDARAAAAAQLQGQPRGPRQRIPRASRHVARQARRASAAPCSRGSSRTTSRATCAS